MQASVAPQLPSVTHATQTFVAGLQCGVAGVAEHCASAVHPPAEETQFPFVQVSPDEHSEEVRHWTQSPVPVSQSGVAGVAAQSPLPAQPAEPASTVRQTPLTQNWPEEQSARVVQPVHVPATQVWPDPQSELDVQPAATQVPDMQVCPEGQSPSAVHPGSTVFVWQTPPMQVWLLRQSLSEEHVTAAQQPF